MGPFPTLLLRNQFGEVSNNVVEGGSSAVSCNFVVDSTNGNGLGIRSLKATPLGVKSIFMHTTQPPAAGSPNPLAGFIMVEFEQGFEGYVNGTFGFVAPVSGTPVNVTAGLVKGGAYTIVSVGTTTPTQWQALGLPVGVTPAVGVSFFAKTATAGVGTGVVEVPAAAGAGVEQIEVVGDPNLSLPANGALCLVCYGSGAIAAPADGTVVGLTFNLIPLPGPLI